jgi:hypothetical protein
LRECAAALLTIQGIDSAIEATGAAIYLRKRARRGLNVTVADTI